MSERELALRMEELIACYRALQDENARLRDVIYKLADQQAVPDNWWRKEIEEELTDE